MLAIFNMSVIKLKLKIKFSCCRLFWAAYPHVCTDVWSSTWSETLARRRPVLRILFKSIQLYGIYYALHRKCPTPGRMWKNLRKKFT